MKMTSFPSTYIFYKNPFDWIFIISHTLLVFCTIAIAATSLSFAGIIVT